MRARRPQPISERVAATIDMSRTTQEVLEFDKLRELLRLRTTCAPGRRAVNARTSSAADIGKSCSNHRHVTDHPRSPRIRQAAGIAAAADDVRAGAASRQCAHVVRSRYRKELQQP